MVKGYKVSVTQGNSGDVLHSVVPTANNTVLYTKLLDRLSPVFLPYTHTHTLNNKGGGRELGR